MLHFESPEQMKACDAYLKDNGILVGALGAYKLNKSLRITIGTEEENQTFISFMKEFIGK
jgi:histidinol-phosphate/aromatic aminotransferase/cobyric acid decarboxylase-like protein